MNKVLISGNLTKDMEVRVVNKDLTIGNFTVAVNEGYGDNQKTYFMPVTVFGENRVGALEKLLLKGAKVNVEGSIRYASDQDDNGDWKNYFNINAQSIEIVKFVEVEETTKKTSKKGRR